MLLIFMYNILKNLKQNGKINPQKNKTPNQNTYKLESKAELAMNSFKIYINCH